MPKDYTQPPYTNMRKSERAQDDDWIRAFLNNAPFGSLATQSQGQPFIHVKNIVYDEASHAIYFHGARTGRGPSNLAEDGRVCLSVSEMGRLRTDEVALEFGVEYASVIVFGKASLLTDDEEKLRGLQMLMDKYFPHLRPGEHYRPITEDELKRTAVYRIDIDEWSGKQEKADDDETGAFFFGSPPEAS